MATILKMIRVALNLTRALPEQILALGNTVLKGLTNNANFPNPPVDLNTLKAALDAFANYIVDAKDGGKKGSDATGPAGSGDPPDAAGTRSVR